MPAGNLLLVFADDLTGALEVGARFAACGLNTRVTVHPTEDLTSPEVLVIDTETRHLSEQQAFETVRQAALAAAGCQPRLVYQKTDSTLRGNIAAEFRALQSVFPERHLVYAPAYPEMGRTVKDGHLSVWGTPLHQTAFALDRLNPVYESNVRTLLNNDSVHLLDGETDEDLTEAANLVLGAMPLALAGGPAALAGALARSLGSAALKPVWPSIHNCLVVSGSLHPKSVEQLSLARSVNCFDERWVCFENKVEGAGLARARQVGVGVRNLLEAASFDALLVFGGDTAFGIHAALGAQNFKPIGEILPGVPVSRCGNLIWMTKAGGFGAPDLVMTLKGLLT